MVLMGIAVMLVLLAVGAAVGPRIYRHYREELIKERILERGTEDQKARLRAYEQRKLDIALRDLELSQARQVLDSPQIQERLRGSNIDVAELSRLLAPPQRDEALSAMRELETELEHHESGRGETRGS